MNRRQFLELGAMASTAFVLGPSRRVARALTRSAVPSVNRLVMTNAVDNIYDIFSRQGAIGSIAVGRTAFRAGPPLLAEHGLAYHLVSFRGEERREILLDFALTDHTLVNNYGTLGVDPARADAFILSHGHSDHYGGLLALLASRQGSPRKGLPLYAGGEDTFCHRVVVTPTGERIDNGQLDRGRIEHLGARVVIATEPAVVAGHAITSGQIPRLTDFEKPPSGARLVVGLPNTACSASLHFPSGSLMVESKPGEPVADTFQGEHATAYHVKDRGLVVITSCGHAGVINSIRQVQKVTGIDKVHAIAGGFHLAPAPDEIVAKTVEALKSIDPDYILPAHCTGLNTIMAIHREMPDRLVMPSTGTRVTFGAA